MSSRNIGSVLFLEELQLQQMVAETAFARLQKAAKSWTQRGFNWADEMVPPRDIIIDCGTFLAAAGVVSKILFEGSRKARVAARCSKLRKLLDIEDCPHLRNLSVRNSFEHVDERIDERFSPGIPENYRVTSLSVDAKPPDAGTIVFKRFDPNALSISFGDDTISLAGCMTEMSSVAQKIKGAYLKLLDNVVELWAT
ncbi:MAG: hypothetical protein NTZ35_17280 [Ignavibacteriales bacterium]|nr:hypothetical protein [Ignavibacteriales bacterium]